MRELSDAALSRQIVTKLDLQPGSDMVNDPSMTILLLEYLADQGCEPCLDSLEGTKWEIVVLAKSGLAEQTGYVPKLGRAVAEGFLLSLK